MKSIDKLDEANRRSAALLAWEVRANNALIDGLAAVRQLGPDAEEAVGVMLELHPLRQLRLQYDLFSALLEGVGHDPEEALAEFLDVEDIDGARYALWGRTPTLDTEDVPVPERHLRLLPPAPLAVADGDFK